MRALFLGKRFFMTEREVNILRNRGVKIISPQEGFQQRFTRSSCDVVFGGGVLNPQPLTSSILTPSGFKIIADIKAGDEIVGIEKGRQYITHCDIEGEKDCIRIELEDGSSAESALDHKWWIIRDGQGDSTAIAFELLEHWQICEERGIKSDVSVFKYIDGRPVAVRLKSVSDIGKKEVACIGVSNDDELYITDDFLITKNCGKAQPLFCGVLTPRGFVNMGDLKEGDVICDPSGGIQTVTRIYEKGERDVFKVYVGLGKYTMCCGEHLWRVWNISDKCYHTMTTDEMRNYHNQLYVDCTAPVEYNLYNGLPLPEDAYSLGKAYSIGKKRVGTDVYRKLKPLGIFSAGLPIPDRYKYGSIKEREDFLRGFVDAQLDEMPPGDNPTIKMQIGYNCARELSEIVSSLGGMLGVGYTSNGVCDVALTMPDIKRYHTPSLPDSGKVNDIVRMRINRIAPAGREVCRCISVSGNSHLYITDEFIVTHNTYAAILMVAEPSLDPQFRAAFTRRNLGNLKQGGGIVDDFKDAYGEYIKVTTSDNPRVSFPTGAYVDCLHIADEEPEKLMERAKGWQYDIFYLDELTSYQFTTFSIIGTRVRGKSRYAGHVFATTNPKRSHWVRKMLDRYIGDDGFILPQMDGVVSWYYQMGDTVDDLEWGRSPEEVYEKCKPEIDRKLKKLGGAQWTYKNLIRSFVFYSGKMSENKASVGNNAKYAAAVAAVGGKRAQQLIEGNWNVDETEVADAPITSLQARAVFTNDECRNGDKWITVDLADVGKNNLLALAWDGFHVFDLMIIEHSTPRQNADYVHAFAAKHDIPDTHIIYDGTRAAYMIDYMPSAIGFLSLASPMGLYRVQADRLKDECYMRLVDVIQNERMSISPEVGKRKYHYAGIREEYSVQVEFIEECSVVRIIEKGNGKKKLASKAEMNKKLGRNRSMDLLDPCAMRMLPVLRYAYGDELDATSAISKRRPEQMNGVKPWQESIYDDSTWF